MVRMIGTELPATSTTDIGQRSPADVRLVEIVHQARLGNAAAFGDLVGVLHPWVFRWALTFARDIDEADEITQETFVLVHRKLDQFRGDSAFEGWVYLITRRVALQRQRKARRRRWLSDSAIPGAETVYHTDPGARVDRQRVTEYIRHFFRELPARQREVFDLVDLQGHDPAEVADMIGVKAATVRANLFKARSSIRARILSEHPSWREIHR
jgi:RNA polymerase sigma-70 factor (ECF subfamily)